MSIVCNNCKVEDYEGCLLYFGIWQTWCCNLPTDNTIVKFDIFEIIRTQMKLHQGPMFIDGMVNSTEVVVHSKTNFVKVVLNQLLFRKPLMLCAN